MQDHEHTTASPGDEPERLANIARRKAILKGLGGTAAAAGAAMPLKSLAGARLRYVENGKNMHCSVSGAMSVLMSGQVNSITQCNGRSATQMGYQEAGSGVSAAQWVNGTPSRPINKANWPEWPNDGTNARTISKDAMYRNPKATFAQVFNGGSATRLGTLLINNPNGDEAQWLTALLNAQRFAGTWPHSPAEVFAHYSGSNAVNALAFYKKINKQVV